MDVLSDVLRVVRLTGGMFLEARFTAPWCVWSRIGPEDCQPLLVAPKHLIAYHCVLEGHMKVGLADGGPVTEVGAGELVLLPRNPMHRIGSSLDVEAILADELVQPPADGGLAQIAHGGGGEATRLVCGFLGCDNPFDPLLTALPEVLTLNLGNTASRAWMESLFLFAAGQPGDHSPGSTTVMSMVSELLFVEALRRYVEQLPGDRRGWLAGIRDPMVGRALALIHSRYQEPWTIDGLAQAVNLSRSAFAERFASLLGCGPIQYLADWRMHRAAQLLRESPRSVAQVAAEVGYESEAAFSRAFKRRHGISPAAWRIRADA
jgi:AraC-like DNA-binding protein